MGGKDEEFLILYFSQDYGHQHVPLTREKKIDFSSTMLSKRQFLKIND